MTVEVPQRGGVFHGMLRFSGAFGTLPDGTEQISTDCLLGAEIRGESRATTRLPSQFSSVTPPCFLAYVATRMFSPSGRIALPRAPR